MDHVMAEQEAMAKAKYGNLSRDTRARSGSIGKVCATLQYSFEISSNTTLLTLQEKSKRFDSADWAMGQEKAPGAPKLSLLQRTLQGELLQLNSHCCSIAWSSALVRRCTCREDIDSDRVDWREDCFADIIFSFPPFRS